MSPYVFIATPIIAFLLSFFGALGVLNWFFPNRTEETEDEDLGDASLLGRETEQ